MEYFANKPRNAVRLEFVPHSTCITRAHPFRHTRAPGVVADLPSKGQPKPIFPLEVLTVLPDQIVPLSKMNERLSSALLDVIHLSTYLVTYVTLGQLKPSTEALRRDRRSLPTDADLWRRQRHHAGLWDTGGRELE